MAAGAEADPIGEKRRRSATRGRTVADDSNTERVLVVDDDAASRRGYELLLKVSGYQVVTASSGREALDRVHELEFDVILSDVNLPHVDGYELTRQLRHESRTRDVPIILVSAYADSARKVAGLDWGADDFLEKPVDVDELLARVRMHVRHSKRSRELIEQSRYDTVTGTLNRRAIDEELDRELKRAARTGLPVSVLMVDIDAFKAFNDRYGHQVGDQALRAVAQKLRNVLRETDHIGRFGGDELLVVLPATDRQSTQALTERIALAWRQHPPMPGGVAEPVLISVGAATADHPMTREALIKVADARMYADKRGDRLRGSP